MTDAIAGIALGWPPILKKAWKALTNKFQDINMLVSLAVIGAICIDEYIEGGVGRRFLCGRSDRTDGQPSSCGSSVAH